jgi:hypothetical protein
VHGGSSAGDHMGRERLLAVLGWSAESWSAAPTLLAGQHDRESEPVALRGVQATARQRVRLGQLADHAGERKLGCNV